MTSFYVVGEDRLIESLFKGFGWEHRNFKDYDVNQIDVFIFGGGADVSPFLYGERAIKETNASISRDLRDIQVFKMLPRYHPKIGICRGAQFLNVMSGGWLFQDVNNHACPQGHQALDLMTNLTIPSVTSTHHQMMIPTDDADVLMVASRSTQRKTDDAIYKSQDKPFEDDIEAVYYDDTNSLCVQFHPEYQPNSVMTNTFKMYIKEFITS